MKLLESLEKEKSIKVNLEAKDWKEAILLSCKPLIDSGAIKKEYYDDIIKSTKEFGPYYILAPGLAMPHAQNGPNVIRNSFSLITLKNPILFEGDDREVNILITLAAKSPEIHTAEALPQVAAAFEDEKVINEVANANSKEEIIKIFSKLDLNKYLPKKERE